MGLDDGATDRQAHTCPAGLCGVKGLKNRLKLRRVNAGPGIAHSNDDPCAILLGADQELSCRGPTSAHGFDSIQDKIQNDLLQLDPISINGSQLVCKSSLSGDVISDDGVSCQPDDLIERRIQIEVSQSRRRTPLWPRLNLVVARRESSDLHGRCYGRSRWAG